MDNLTIDRDRGLYRFTHKGKALAYPSVTAVLQRFFPPHISEEARWKGKYVHAATCLLDGGGDGSGLAWDRVPLQVKGYLDAWERFKKDMEGTLAGATWLIDLKTGAKEEWHALQTAAYLEAFQRTAYPAAVWIERPVFSLKYRFAGTLDRVWIYGPKRRRLSVYLRETGDYTMEEWSDPGDLPAFLGMLTAANWMGNHGTPHEQGPAA